ncbi:insulinase family protein [Flammeovirga yaeyamensis]|uniref:Insulinase family protein n=1 Tax=Flammeovirga yaeyamensis TaxID=367791 RepID=A0AAX1N2A7_9BACT|nr:pitrilysin family protein [Flammeovirga yaeyamensis]MBB3701105.1 putative Zn-dependent peptidase [Flammeovirga yaeyamensis]NMF38428.1 insulinase family protein [Flammeovirga yaeyamensis]QWG01572.1 insulinase family protein [Flammeovirga yaeyamensis]
MNHSLDRTIAPESFQLVDFSLQKPEQYQLPNSCKVFAIKNNAQPILHFSIVIKGGKLVEDVKGTAFLTSKMIGEGVKGMNSAQIHEYLDSYGAIINVSNDLDSFTLTGHCLKRYFGEVISMVNKYLKESEFSEEEFRHIVQVVVQQKKLAEEKTSYLSTKKFRESFYGEDHPFGSTLSAEQILQFSIDDVQKYYNDQIIGAPFEIFISGDFDDSCLKILSDQLGKIEIKKGSAILKYPKFVDKINSNELKIYDAKDGSVQSSIRIGCPTFTLPHNDLEAFSVMNEMLGGYFGSRLMKNIREEKGLTYGIHSSFRNEQNQGYFLIATDVKKELREVATTEIYKEIEKLGNEPISQEELITVQNYMSGNFIMSINSNISLLEVTKGLYKKGLDFDYYDTYVSRIQSVTTQQVQDMVKKYLLGDMLEVVVG